MLRTNQDLIRSGAEAQRSHEQRASVHAVAIWARQPPEWSVTTRDGRPKRAAGTKGPETTISRVDMAAAFMLVMATAGQAGPAPKATGSIMWYGDFEGSRRNAVRVDRHSRRTIVGHRREEVVVRGDASAGHVRDVQPEDELGHTDRLSTEHRSLEVQRLGGDILDDERAGPPVP